MAYKNCFYFILLHISLSFVLTQSAPIESLVTHLPGYNGTLPSKHYAGYVTVDESHGRNLYYYFVESESKPSKDPLVLWLNGGPGCSSFDGFVYEHGPFNFKKPNTRETLPTLQLNPYSWSKVSNVIYLDSPAGVGFSYSKNESDYKTGDVKVASDTHNFLLKWLELYPEFLTNPFFISGESYAGIYVPTLADKVVQGIEAGIKPKLNFKGYLVGNAVTDEKFDGNAFVPFAHGMTLISDDLFEDATRECNGTFYKRDTDQCYALLSKINEVLEGLDIYNILTPCYHGGESETFHSKLPLSFKQLGKTKKPLPVRKRMFGRAWPLGLTLKDGRVPTWPELSLQNLVSCTDNEVATVWLNNHEVRKAIHTAEKSVVSSWVLCTGDVDYNHDTGSMIPYHKNLTSKGYRALVYSGDHDLCVPYTGSQAWTRSVGYKIVDEWRPWLVDDQVSGDEIANFEKSGTTLIRVPNFKDQIGYTQGYDHNLTFLTVKGSGHTVPEYKPKESLHFYKQFINGLPI